LFDRTRFTRVSRWQVEHEAVKAILEISQGKVGLDGYVVVTRAHGPGRDGSRATGNRFLAAKQTLPKIPHANVPFCGSAIIDILRKWRWNRRKCRVRETVAVPADRSDATSPPVALEMQIPAGLPKKPDYWFFFFSCLAARFSFIVLAGFFFSVFFESMPLLMSCSAMWKVGRERHRRSGTGGKIERGAIGV
jgi:hypothetical protein